MAVKVIQRLLDKVDIVCHYKYNHSGIMFSEFQFRALYQMLSNVNPTNPQFCKFISNNWRFDGFYQFDFYIIEHRQYLRSLFTPQNTEQINNQYRVCDIVNEVIKYKPMFHADDMVTHVRLDDFSHIINHSTISQILNSQPFHNSYVVVDKRKQDWEHRYIKEFQDSVSFHLISHDNMFQDLAYLWYAPNLICNNSTFCWIAGILGNCQKSWCPKQLNHNYPQSFQRVNFDTIIYDWKEYKY